MLESKRIQTMAYQLLEPANLKNEQIDMKEQKISELFESVRQTLHNRIAQKDIRVEFIEEIDTLSGDACLLQSLLENLIDNAIKACDVGGQIKVCADVEAGKKIIHVQDNGKGMDNKDLRHITEPFIARISREAARMGQPDWVLPSVIRLPFVMGRSLRFSATRTTEQ